MLTDEIYRQVMRQFGLPPTDDQTEAVRKFAAFLTDRHARSAMILRGSAGTGKTSLASAMVRAMNGLGQKTVLLAPTGRAAKVFSLHAGKAAHTIHRVIYRQKQFNATGGLFSLADNLHRHTLFMVDEASMIANEGMPGLQAGFGSGRLLDDLVEYVYGGQGCRILFIGDKAQLPPVGETESPALSADVLQSYFLQVHEADLGEVVRQACESGILYNATRIRQMIGHDELTGMPRIRFSGFADIRNVPGDELIECLSSSYNKVGLDETMVVTRSNKRANIYNQGIRNMILGREDLLTQGDSVMVVKNNYYWTERSGMSDEEKKEFSFIANGDRATVLRVRNNRQLYGFSFADLTLRFPDYDDKEITVTALTDSLKSEAPSLTRQQQEQLFQNVMEDYVDIPQKRKRLEKIREDPCYNALQIKFAYAVTCHKAQGGQWAHVYVDQGYMTADMMTADYIRWLYTAFTRATEVLYLVNWKAGE